MRGSVARVVCSLLSTGVLFGSSAAIAQPLGRVSSDFQVNTYTQFGQKRPRIASHGDGLIVVWESNGQYGIFGRRLDGSGNVQGSPFQVNSHSARFQSLPVVAAAGDGDFVVVWQSDDQDGAEEGIFARRFASDGMPHGAEFQVNVFTDGYQAVPDVAASAEGSFVVTWTSYAQDGAGGGVFARRYDSSGAAQGGEFQVNAISANYDYAYDVAFQGDGDFIVVWGSFGSDASSTLLARRFDSAGSPQGTEIQLNLFTADVQVNPSIAVEDDDDFLVVWNHSGFDGSQGAIVARRFDSAGSAQGPEFLVNAHTTSDQGLPAVAFEDSGKFVIAWSSALQDGSDTGVFARRFDAAGVPQGGDLQVNAFTSDDQSFPDIALITSDLLMVVFEDFGGRDGGVNGIFAQRVGTPSLATLDVDGNGDTAALTDGLLIVRHRFGLTGTSLTSAAVGGGCTRCDGDSISAYLGGLGNTLDVDGNGSLTALTDGLLALRYLFNLSDTALTSGVVGMGCTRCDAAAILPYLQSLE